ncbi:MAG: hypothetical protein HYU77_04795 [Betaproteobacteria bacterium]|nr:hypothetical protein [Betaproteobacteria bacterium]
MGYKRRARILFVCRDDGASSRMAEAFANALGADVMEARSAGIAPTILDPSVISCMAEAGIELGDRPATALDPELVAWADLVITLDETAERNCPPSRPGAQRRFFPFPAPDAGAGAQAYSELRDRIRARVEGMIGGLRMMARDPA